MWLPALAKLVTSVATPALRVALPSVVVPSLKVTVPVGLAPVTLALSVTDWPAANGFAERLPWFYGGDNYSDARGTLNAVELVFRAHPDNVAAVLPNDVFAGVA